jgi:SOS-response transcriptional repressor LexA
MPVELPYPLPAGTSPGQRIRFHRQRLALKQAELAARAKINQGYLSGIERGQRTPSPSTLRAIADALGLPTAVLVGDGRDHDAPQPLETREVPLFGAIPAGPPSATQEQPDAFPVLRHLWGPDRYCLRLSYDSMEPTLKPGDIILVHYRPDVNPEHVQGRICACLVDGQPTLKRVLVEQHVAQRQITLRGDNPTIPPILIAGGTDFSIQGVVLALVSREL